MAAFSALYQSGRKWLGLSSTDTALDTELKAWTNDAYREVVGAFDWDTRRASDVLQLEAKEDTSTLQAAVVGATALTINDAVWDTAWSGYKIRINDETYDVTTFGSTTTATLADGLTKALDGGESYIVYKEEYALPSAVDKLVGIFPGSSSYPALGRVALDVMFGYKSRSTDPQDFPRVYSIVGTNASGVPTIVVHPAPASRQNLHVKYDRVLTELSGDADIPTLLPDHAHHLIAKRLKGFVYEFDRAQESIMLMDRANRDFRSALALEVNRSRSDSPRVRLDGAVFGSRGSDQVADIIARESY